MRAPTNLSPDGGTWQRIGASWRRLHTRGWQLTALLALLGVTVVAACGDEITGPRGRFELQPLLPALRIDGQPAPFPEGSLRVRVTTARGDVVGDTAIAVSDTTVEIAVGVRVRFRGAEESVFATAELIAASGDTLFRAGPAEAQFVRLGSSQPPLPPAALEMTYVGPGAGTAASLQITAAVPGGFAGDTLLVTADVLDGGGAPIPRVPLVWALVDTTTGRVLRPSEGRVVLGESRATAVLRAFTFTGLADTTQLAVEPLPTAVDAPDGTTRSDTVGNLLQAPLAARLVAGDGGPVRGLGVRFVGLGALSGRDTIVVSDDDGIARADWLLPTTVGAYEVEATPLRGTGSTRFSIAAIAAAAESLSVDGGPSGSVRAGDTLPALTVSLVDRFGNVVATRSDAVDLVLLDSSDAVVGVPSSVAAVDGIATYAALQVEPVGVDYAFEARVAGFPSRRSAPFTVTAAPAAQLVLRTPPADTILAGDSLGVIVEAQDPFGNLATDFGGAVTATLAVNPTQATLAGTVTAEAVGGVADFRDISVTRVGSGYTLAFAATGLSAASSEAITVLPAAASRLAITQQPPAFVIADSTFALAAEVQDAFGNLIATYANDVTLAIGANPGAAVLGGSLTATPDSGRVSFAGVTLSASGVGYTLVVSSGALAAATTNPFTVTNEAPSTGYWRFEGAGFLESSGSAAPLTLAGSPQPIQITLPASGRGSRFPRALSTGANASAAEFAGGSGSGRMSAVVQLSQRFTIEAFVHFDGTAGVYGKSIAGFGDPSDSPWNIAIRNDGLFGTTPGEFTVGGSTAATGDWMVGSGIVLQSGVDYYVAVAFDASGTVTFWVRDLTNGGPLQRVERTHGVSALPADTRFFIGDQQTGSFDFEVDGLIDEVRLSDRVLAETELLIDGAVQALIALSTDTVAFSGFAGSAATPEQIVTITNAGAGFLNGLSVGPVAYAAGQPTGWLSVGALSGNGAPASFSLVADPAALSTGTYTATLPVSSTSPDVVNSPREITVTFTVSVPIAPLRSLVATGVGHTCAVGASGDISCSGANSLGELGNGTTTPSTLPVTVNAPGVTFTSVGAGRDLTCGLSADGVAYCWGGGGPLGDGTTASRSTPVAVQAPAGVSFRQLAVGYWHSCAIATDDQTYCWGQNFAGQLGDGSTTPRNLPTPVTAPPGVRFVQVATSWLHTCALTPEGDAFCWGNNGDGQLGDGTFTNRLVPVRVSRPNGVTFAQIWVGSGRQTCAVTPAGVLYCWGANGVGQLGDGSVTQRRTPVRVAAPAGVAFARVGLSMEAWQGGTSPTSSCGVTTAGAAYCWGANDEGQLGDGSVTGSNVPAAVALPAGVVLTDIATSGRHSCGRTATGDVYCWGANEAGQVGDGSALRRVTPAQYGQEASPALSIVPASIQLEGVAGGAQTAAQGVAVVNSSAGTLSGLEQGAVTYAAGEPTGWLQVGALSAATAPATFTISADPSSLAVGTYSATVEVASTDLLVDDSPRTLAVRLVVEGEVITPAPPSRVAAANHTCVIGVGGTVTCAGDNAAGQLGDGTTTQRPTPTALAAPAGLAFSQIAAGLSHSCAVAADGTTRCWGNNSNGQLGDGSLTQQLAPVQVALPGGTVLTQVSAGDSHSCGVTSAGAAYCWGTNVGRLGNGATAQSSTPVAVSAPAGVSFVQVSAGGAHSCGVAQGGAAYCWGSNVLGGLGDGSSIQRLSPVPVSLGGVPVVQVAAGFNHTCAVTAVGQLRCWGGNPAGQLGDGSSTTRLTPVPVAAPGGERFVQVSAGTSHSCAVSAAGRVYCWGNNLSGQLGDGTTSPRLTPTLAATPAGVRFVQVAAGRAHTCAMAIDDSVYCWGANTFGQIADRTAVTRPTPVRFGQDAPPALAFTADSLILEGALGAASPVVQTVTVFNASTGTLSGLSVAPVSYGAGEPTGWLDVGALSASSAPATFSLSASSASLAAGVYTATITVSSSAPDVANSPRTLTLRFVVRASAAVAAASSIASAGGSHSCAVDANGVVNCSGDNAFGQLGDVSFVSKSTPVAAATPAGLTFTQVASGLFHSCALTTTGSAYCWGRNNGGQLGNGVQANENLLLAPTVPGPVAAPGGATFAQISAGGLMSCAVTTTGAVYCWGSGNIGNGSFLSLVPVAITLPPGARAAAVAVGRTRTCVLSTTGTAYCWGAASGNGSTASPLTPVLVASPPGTSFTRIASGDFHGCAVTTDGDAYCWGNNLSGQLGDGTTTTTRLVPTRVLTPSGVRFTGIAAGAEHSCAVTADGAAYCWGANNQFQVGDGTSTARATPTRVVATAGAAFSEVSAGVSHSCASTAGGSVYCWGANLQGQLGDATQTSRPLPVPFAPLGAAIRLSTSQLSIVSASGGSALPPQVISVLNGGSGPLTGLALGPVTYAAGQPTGWLAVGALSSSGAPASFTVSADVAGLAAGTYTASFAVSSTAIGVQNNPQQVEVTFSVTAPVVPTLLQSDAGGFHTCAIGSDGVTRCAGNNSFGQLGNGDFVASATPVVVAAPGGVSFVQVATGNGHSCGLTAAGVAYCWGGNLEGQTGDGNTVNRATPGLVAAPAGVTFTQLATGVNHTCGVTPAGAVYCWGWNLYGQLGEGSTSNRITPTLVPAPPGVTFAQVTAGHWHSCALSTNGWAYCWGLNNAGQLGDGTNTQRFAPVQVAMPVGRTFTQVQAGAEHSCAIASDGSAFCWGRNNDGQLGSGAPATTRPGLVAMPTGQSFVQLDVGYYSTCAVSASGSTYCWGRNTDGQVGDGSTSFRPTPTLVAVPGGVSFARVSAGDRHSCARSTGGATYCWGYNVEGRLGDGSTTARFTPVGFLEP